MVVHPLVPVIVRRRGPPCPRNENDALAPPQGFYFILTGLITRRRSALSIGEEGRGKRRRGARGERWHARVIVFSEFLFLFWAPCHPHLPHAPVFDCPTFPRNPSQSFLRRTRPEPFYSRNHHHRPPSTKCVAGVPHYVIHSPVPRLRDGAISILPLLGIERKSVRRGGGPR